MDRKVVWTEPAWQDLESAAEFIARDSESYATASVQEVKASVTYLTQFAEMGQIVPEFEDSNIRELLLSPYRLIYEVSDD